MHCRVCTTRFGPPHLPFTFYMQFCMGGRNPRKTRSAGLRRHGQPALIAYPRCRRAPGISGGEPAQWGGHRCKLSVSPEAGRTRFSGVAPGVASTHTKSHVKSEGGWSAPGCCQNRVWQTRPDSVPPKGIWRLMASKPTLKDCCVTGYSAVWRDDETSCLLYTSPSPRDGLLSRMPSSA